MTSTIKTIILVLVIAGIGYFGYNYLTRTNVAGDSAIQQESANTSKMGAEVLTALNQLKVLKLDGAVFKDKTFLSLKDFSKPLNPESIGRVNPFSPIGVENTASVKLTPAVGSTTPAIPGSSATSSTRGTPGN
jgi:hypothetical protein